MHLRVAARAAIVTALAVAALAGVAPTPAAAARPDRAFFGMQAWTVPNARDFATMNRGGVGTFRAVLDAAQLGASPSEAHWAPYDAMVAAAARARIEVLPMLMGTPGTRVRLQRPRTRARRIAWGSFVTAVAQRYGRDGTFWAAHPELDPMPFKAYQVWNEPNLPAYWRPAPDAAGYMRLVRLTRARLRAVDPKATIVLAGLPDSRLGIRMLDYLRAIYAQPGARTLFDVVAVHPYARDPRDVIGLVKGVRAHMDRRGDHRTPIWVTELGWGTGGPRSPYSTTKAGQAAKIAQTFRTLIAIRNRLRLERVVVSVLQDRAFVAAEKPWWAPRTGLFDRTGRPKPAWRAFVGFAGGTLGGRLPAASPAVDAPRRRGS
jgi:hypothetical protein